MPIELNLLKSFVAIVDHGNFLTASGAVAKSPAAVSVHIKRLEEALGKSLFARDARTTRLTLEGKKLLPHARRMLALEASIHSEFDKAPIRGKVLLGVPDDVVERFPMKALNMFANEYPNVSLGIRVDQTPSLLKSVSKKELDLAIITYVESIDGVRESEKILTEPEIWACCANGIASENTPLPITIWDKRWPWYEPTIAILDDAGIEYNIILECENITGRKSAIAADLAVGPLPLSQLDDKVIAAPGFQDMPPLPEYGLGMKICDAPSEAVLAVAEHLRSHISYTGNPQ